MQYYTTHPDARTQALKAAPHDRVTRNFLRLAAISFALGAQVVMLYDARPSNDSQIDDALIVAQESSGFSSFSGDASQRG